MKSPGFLHLKQLSGSYSYKAITANTELIPQKF